MNETLAANAALPVRICEKCRRTLPSADFQHGVGGQETVCHRCLVVMGYQVAPL